MIKPLTFYCSEASAGSRKITPEGAQVQSLGCEHSLEKQPILQSEIHGQGNLVGYSL